MLLVSLAIHFALTPSYMRSFLRSIVGICIATFALNAKLNAQCSITTATGCVCATTGQTDCDLLPDMTISWNALSTVSAGPSEFGQTGADAARLRVSGSTPNVGKGNLEVRGQTDGSIRAFICGTDTVYVTGSQTNFTCANGLTPKQILYQRVYHKNGNVMSYNDVKTGTMTYHPTHGHYHVDDWTTMTLRIQDPNEPLPTRWPIVATGAKIGFCLMDYYNCWEASANGHCRTSQLWQQGSVLNTTGQFPNNGMGRGYSCSANYQGISTGRTDLYGEWLDGMWINLMPDLCNGNYWIVAEVDPQNVFREENDANNWTAMPFTLALQRAANSGGSAWIKCDGRPVLPPGGTVTLTATPGASYAWNTGATSRSITVSQPGNYSCSVSAPCGTLITGSLTVTSMAAPSMPTATGATVTGPSSADLACTGSNPQWYEAANGGEPIANGTSFSTPVLNNTTTYYVADRTTLAMNSLSGGMAYSPSNGANFNGKQWLLFDAFQPFTLRTVQVYSNAVGIRHFVLVDNVGNLIAEKQIELLTGLQTVQLDFEVPVGTQHKISAYDSGATSSGTQLVLQDLHRSSTGVSYPYSLGTAGSITGSSGGSTYYYFLYNWQIEQPEVVAESARVPVVAEVVNGVVLDAKVLLSGPFDEITGLMHDSLRVRGLLPLNEPYAAMGFPQTGPGGEAMPAGLLSAAGNNAVVDWIRVELRSASTPATVVAAQSAVVTRNGQVLSANGTALRFSVPNGNYHVAVRHRNHLGIMTAAPVALSAVPFTLDLTNPGTAAFGTSARKVQGSLVTMWSGEVVRDGYLIYTGENNDRDVILGAIGGIVPTNTASGYILADVNLDGTVKYTGEGNDRDPILSNVGGVIPTNTRQQQLP
jgi:hypothetical protein